MKAAIVKKTLHDLVTSRCPSDGNYVKYIEDHHNRVRRYNANATAATKLTPEQEYEHLSNFVSNVDGLNDVDDQATLFSVATQTAVPSQARMKLIEHRALMATSKSSGPSLATQHRAFVAQHVEDNAEIPSNERGSYCIEEGAYTVFVSRSRVGNKVCRGGTRIPTSLWRLLSDNDKKQWLRISANGRHIILGPDDDDDKEEEPAQASPRLPSARRGSSHQVNFTRTEDSLPTSDNTGRIDTNTAEQHPSTLSVSNPNGTRFINALKTRDSSVQGLDVRLLMADPPSSTSVSKGEQVPANDYLEKYYPKVVKTGELKNGDQLDSTNEESSPLKSAIKQRPFPRGLCRLKPYFQRTSRR